MVEGYVEGGRGNRWVTVGGGFGEVAAGASSFLSGRLSNGGEAGGCGGGDVVEAGDRDVRRVR